MMGVNVAVPPGGTAVSARPSVALIALLVFAGIAGCGGSDDVATPTGGSPTTGTVTGSTTGKTGSTPDGTGTAPARAPSTPGSRTSTQARLAGGTSISYTVVLPNDYARGKTFPVLVAFPPGGQGQPEVDALLDRLWAPEAKRRGWIVVSPVAPASGLFFGESSKLVPGFLDAVAAAYPPEGGKFHLAGVSNGGLSAFRAALDTPRRFSSLLVAPGFPPDESDRANLKKLTSIPVAMYVGEHDSGWREPSARTAAELTRLGGKATLTVSPGEDHILRKITGKQLFDVLETTR